MYFEIKKASLDNAKSVSLLTQELGYFASESESAGWLGTLLDSNYHEVFVAKGKNEITCGWIVVEKRISLEAGWYGEITALVVGSLYRKHGIGGKLVQSAEKWASEASLKKLLVRSDVSRNESHVFYRQIGFSLAKTSHNYVKEIGS